MYHKESIRGTLSLVDRDGEGTWKYLKKVIVLQVETNKGKSSDQVVERPIYFLKVI